MRKINLLTVAFISFSLLVSCTSRQEKMEKKLQEFISAYEAEIIPLYKEMALTSWNANITGKDSDFALSEKAAFELNKVYTDTMAFAGLKEIKESKAVQDPVLARQLDLIYDAYLGNQIDTALIAERLRMETEITKKYGNFRAKLNNKELSDNQIDDILRNSTSGKELQSVWEAHKLIGPVVAKDVIDLVKIRNRIARQIGFSNYHEMSLKLSGQDPAEVTAVFDELDNLTKENFSKLKDEIDAYYSKRYKISASELRPWHYQNRYFQDAPEIYPVDLDQYYEKQDPVKLASTFFNAIGLNAAPVLAKSDLYEKPGKNQHAFSTDIDRAGDVRTLDNIRPDLYWMNTILHELGHGVYSYYNDMTLPFTLRDAAHPFTTEAIANMFGRFSKDPEWMKEMGIIDETEREKISDFCHKSLKLEMLVFSRWAQVMYRFEKSMYENPDQDLDRLWWELVEKYQMILKPEGRNMPDWATKIHVALYPCYYHNYLLGELLASQLYSYITTNITKNPSFVGDIGVGTYLKENVFKPGARYYWNDMIEKATGEKLTAKYYAKQFVE